MGYLVFALQQSRQGWGCRVGKSVLIKPNWLYVYSCWMRSTWWFIILVSLPWICLKLSVIKSLSNFWIRNIGILSDSSPAFLPLPCSIPPEVWGALPTTDCPSSLPNNIRLCQTLFFPALVQPPSKCPQSQSPEATILPLPESSCSNADLIKALPCLQPFNGSPSPPRSCPTMIPKAIHDCCPAYHPSLYFCL